MRSKLLTAAAAVLAMSVLAACGGGGGGGGDAGGTIKIGYPSDTASYGDLYVCQDEGIFKKHGLDVELTLLKTSSQLLAALTSGSVQIAGGDGAAVADGAVKGTDLKVVAMKLPVYFVEMWGREDITSLDDLQGKTVGVTAPGSVTDASTRIKLEQAGLTDSVKVRNLTDLPALLSAGQKGAIDALVTAPPQGKSTEQFGWHKITDMTDIKTAASVYTVTGDYANDNPKTVQSFVDAEAECLDYLQNNADGSIKAIASHTGTDDMDQATYAYEFFKKIWNTDPTVDESLIQQALDESGGSHVKASDYVDNSFVEKAKEDGSVASGS